MGKLLLLLFTAVPLLEAYLLVLLGTNLGFWPTVLIVLATGLIGAFLAKREGLKVWREWREALAKMQMPEEGIVGGLLVLVGGVLLITPGVLTDVVGLSLLFPPSRKVIAGFVRRYLKKRFQDGGEGGFSYSVRVGGGDMPGARASGPTRARVEDPRAGFGIPRGRRPRGMGAVIDTEAEVLETRRPDRAESA